MSLGRREARHQTVAAARTAGVTPEDYWDFKPGQKVMTADGFAGTVASVEDGFAAGTETYDVVLDNGMGGGQYTASLLRAMPQSTANVDVKTAADDYPELGTILLDRPPLAMSTKGSLQTTAWDREEWDERNDEHERDHDPCTGCSGTGELQDGTECARCDASGQEPEGRRTAAYDHGDPDTYTASHDCPACGSNRALESAVGVIKCEDCGYEEQNGSKDGYGGAPLHPSAPKVAGWQAIAVGNAATSPIRHDENRFPTGATCARCGYSHRDAKPGESCLLCDGQMSRQPEKIVHALLENPYRLLVVAAADSEFRFHVTASWSDVRAKAKRLRAEGGINIIAASGGTVVANVKGDHHVYETEIVRMGSNAVAQWHCGCKWGSYTWGRSASFKRFEGRMCSHALALHFEAQSQGMFGRQVSEEEKAPSWLKQRTRVVTDFDKDQRKNVSRPAQPRKRDRMRSYASLVQTEDTPVEALIATALNEGIGVDEILVSLSVAGIDARPMFAEAAAPDGYRKTKPGSHHKDRSGDLAPCANGGCGHPEGIHGEDGGDCNSQGCECHHYQGVGSPKEASLETEARRKKKKKAKHSGHHHHDSSHEYRRTPSVSPSRGYGAWWHGIGWGGGYGLGYGNGYYGPGEGSGSGGGGESGGGDGGGDSSGAAGDIVPVFKTAAFPIDTMDPTYTEGNPTRHWDDSHGAWNATSPNDPNANPAQRGWATSGDPKEFDVDSSAFSRIGVAGWPRFEARGIPNPLKAMDTFMDSAPMGFARDMLGLEQYNRVIQRAIGDDDYQDHSKKPLSKNPLDWVPLVGGGKTKVVTKAPKYIKNPSKLVDDVKGVPSKVRDSLTKTVDDVAESAGVKSPVKAPPKAPPAPPKVPGPRRPAREPVREPATVPAAPPKAPPAPPKAPPKTPSRPPSRDPIPAVPPKAPPAPPKAPPAAPKAPERIPGTPGTGTPANPAPGPATAPGGPLKPGAPAPRGTRPADKPGDKVGPKGRGDKDGPEGKDSGNGRGEGRGRDKDGGKGRRDRGRRPRRRRGGGNFFWPNINLPQGPDYYVESNELVGRGIGARSSLIADLLRQEAALTEQQEFANGVADNLESLGGPSLPRYEAELNEEPEPALPTTDGTVDPDADLAPAADSDGLASTGHLGDHPEDHDERELMDDSYRYHDDHPTPVSDHVDPDEIFPHLSAKEEESVDDIVSAFQATAGAVALASGSAPGNHAGAEGDDVASAAKAFLAKESMKTFSPAEQKQIIDEGMDVKAANLDRLNIEGTHYEALEAALASQTDDDDLEF